MKKKIELIVPESRLLVTRGWGVSSGWRKRGDFDQRVQTFSYKMNKLWKPNIQHGDYS